jgi:hypothetical protein
MKKLTLVLGLLLLASGAQAQVYVQGSALTDPQVRHLIVRPTKQGGKFQAFLELDGIRKNREDKLTDSDGTVLGFEYLPGLFDHLDRAGWEYIDSIAPTVWAGTSQGILEKTSNTRFLFRRKNDAELASKE